MKLCNKKEPLIKDEKIRKLIKLWCEINQINEIKIYPLVFDHGGVCIINTLFRFTNPPLRTSIEIWLEKEFNLKKEIKRDEYKSFTVAELCGEEEE